MKLTHAMLASVLVANLSGLVAAPAKLAPPQQGSYYTGAFPDFIAAPEMTEGVVGQYVANFTNLIGKKAGWIYLPNDFTDGIHFPYQSAYEIYQQGSVPYIRVLPRSQRVQNQGADPVYRLDAIIQGQFDSELRTWCKDARSYEAPLLVEFAPEANGRWYGWNALWNGAGELTGYGDPKLADGPERLRDVYRHFIDICRAEKADNITWFFHVDSQPKPVAPWNKMALYYPGDNYIDWIGVSVFGAQTASDKWEDFADTLNSAYAELAAISKTKPLAVVEAGVMEDEKTPGRKASWINRALTSLRMNRFPRIGAFAYWHEKSWVTVGTNNLRLDSSPTSLSTYKMFMGTPNFTNKLLFIQ